MQKRITLARRKPKLETWDDVRIFLAVHRAGSLSGAAGPLGVTQPTVGRRLAALERSLGMILFDRTPTGLQITAEGSTLLQTASSMEERAEELTLRAELSDRDLEGLVRVASTEAFASAFLLPALAQVRKKYPAIVFELVLSNIETDLLKREADIAFRFRPEGLRPEPEALVAQKRGEEPHLLYGADSYLELRGAPADPTRLAEHDVVAYTGRHPAAEWCKRAFEGATIVLAVPSMQLVATALAAGMGLGVLPKRAARMFPELRALSAVG